MEGKLHQPEAGRRVARGMRFTIVAVLSLSLAAVAGPALAKKLSGSKRGETIAGTKGADKIKGKGGNDKLKGKGGNDSLNGGKGRDSITGGTGTDRHLGGAGDDLLKAGDGRVDKAIDGGAGNNTCIIDTQLELSVFRNCSTIKAGGPGAGGPGPGPGEGLRLQSASTTPVDCNTSLPVCVFSITGDGADASFGTVTGGGGVTAVGGAAVVTGSEWTASGVYGCTADGFLRITIGSESLDFPIYCS